MADATKHLDRRNTKRQGWFQKTKADGKPAHKDYKKSCVAGGRGYMGPRHEAHHVLPQTSIEQSKTEYVRQSEGSKADMARYVGDVQWVTKWNINQPDNMIGLPTFHSYEQYFQMKDRLASEKQDPKAAKKLVSWFNEYASKTRKKWLKAFQAGVSPEKHPVHNPVNWGHADYNELVMRDIKAQVWSQIDIKRRKHELDAAAVKAQLEALSEDWADDLLARASRATREQWSKRGKEPKWHTPFTMADVPDPLRG